MNDQILGGFAIVGFAFLLAAATGYIFCRMIELTVKSTVERLDKDVQGTCKRLRENH